MLFRSEYVPEILKHLNELGLKCIHVIRPSPIETVLSQLTLAYRHEAGLLSHDSDSISNSAEIKELFVDLPPRTELLGLVQQLTDNIKTFRRYLGKTFGPNYIECFHPSSLSRSHSNGYQRLLDFLGVGNFYLRSSIAPSRISTSVIYSDPTVLQSEELKSFNLEY